MSEYTRVSVSARGDELLLTNSYGMSLPLYPEEIAALREFFQAERDAELGRWLAQFCIANVHHDWQRQDDGLRAVVSSRLARLALLEGGGE